MSASSPAPVTTANAARSSSASHWRWSHTIAMVGLVLDGGSAFAQRRDQQSAADLAALAGANDYLLNHDDTLAAPVPGRSPR